jgi:hypothetical protein
MPIMNSSYFTGGAKAREQLFYDSDFSPPNLNQKTLLLPIKGAYLAG